MRTYELTDAELNNYMYEQDLMEQKNFARYLNGEVVELENLLTKYENQRAELKAEKKSTRSIANRIRDCKKYIKQTQEKLENTLNDIAKMKN